jgi:hypothetical protein
MKNAAHLSKETTLKRLGLYSKMGNERQFFDIQKLKRAYKIKQQEIQQKRMQRDAFYAQGLRSGLPHKSYETLIHQREVEDRKSRVQLLAEAKGIYHKGQNLSRWLNKEVDNIPKISKSKNKPKNRNQPKPKSLRNYFNNPVSVSQNFNKHKNIHKER